MKKNRIEPKAGKVKSLLIFTSVLLFLTGAYGQKIINTPSVEEFEKFYDTIYPRNTEKFDSKFQEYSIDVRIEPSFSSPSQLSITKYRDGRFIAYRFDLVNRKQSLFEQILSLETYEKAEDLQVLAKELKIEKRTVENIGLIKPSLNKFFRDNNFRQETRISLDGILYRIWYVDTGSEFYFSQVGSEKFEKNESPLVSFVREVIIKTDKPSR